jgi:histidine phosphatase superfamily protein (branch 1)
MRQISMTRMLTLWMLPAILLSQASAASLLVGKQLITALAGGGYVIVMRPATSSESPPTAAQAEPSNVSHERQLDDRGRAAAHAMGEALRHLKIPVGQVLSSTAYRALETAGQAQLPDPHSYDDLAEAGLGPEQTGSLRAQVGVAPAAGTNTIIITHLKNISAAFPADAKDLAEGEALIYRPNGKGAAALVGRMKIEEWPKAASAP